MSAASAQPDVHARRRANLALANDVRTRNAQVKRDLTERRRSLAGVLTAPDCGRVKVIDALLATPAIGRGKALDACRRAGISTSARMEALTERQRRELTIALYRYPSVRPCLITAPAERAAA